MANAGNHRIGLDYALGMIDITGFRRADNQVAD
jgi:hypothetical protein